MNETTTSPSAVLEPESQPVKRGRGRPPKAKPVEAAEPVAPAPVTEVAVTATEAAPEIVDALAELEQEASETKIQDEQAPQISPVVATVDEGVSGVNKSSSVPDAPPVESNQNVNEANAQAAATFGQPPVLLYVKKVQAGMPFFVNKEKLNFEMLGSNVGVGIFNETTQVDKCAAIRLAAAAHRGGLVIIDEPTYQGLKKKLGPALARKSISPLKVFRPNDHLPKLKNLPVVNAAAASVGSTAAPTGMSQTGAVGGSSAPVKFTPSTRRFGPRPIAPPPPLARPID